jgi:GTP-binding protein Era
MFRAQLPEGPAYFDKDAITDRSERYFVTEIIREKILKLYKEEIPYSCEVVINSFVEGEELDKISAEIYVNRKTQKPILIGKNGEMIKQLGIESRIDIEKFLDKKVYLELHVKVLENWRDNDSILSKFGY